jgi:diguanylate cyclase (GGDEF)-like protein
MKRRKNGETYAAWETIDLVCDAQGLVSRYIVLFSDITPLNESHSRLHYLAHHDCLTGLSNRLLFWARLEQSVAKAQRHGRCVALLYLDLDRFKQINDRLGHSGGDQLLKLVAERLQGKVRREDTIARLGGDEFALIIEELSESQDAMALATELGSEIRKPMIIEGESVCPSCSFGIAIYPHDGQSPESLYKVADARMYQMKHSKRRLSTQTDQPGPVATAAFPMPLRI